ncbi:hypothetical protein [Martelella limonii]
MKFMKTTTGLLAFFERGLGWGTRSGLSACFADFTEAGLRSGAFARPLS